MKSFAHYNQFIKAVLFYFTVLSAQAGTQHTESPDISPRLLSAPKIADDRIKEASGLAPSHLNQDVFWTHNDSGDSAAVFAVGADGSAQGYFVLKNCQPTDIEDIAVGSGPAKNSTYIYLADIGDNGKSRKNKKIYRFREPLLKQDSKWQPIENFDVINFSYPDDQCYDAETLLLDPLTKDLLIITKRGKKSDKKYDLIFKLPYPQQTGKLVTAEPVGKIEIPTGFMFGYGCTGGDISADGTQLIVKTYTNIYYWERNREEDFMAFFKRPYRNLPYTSQEGQG